MRSRTSSVRSSTRRARSATPACSGTPRAAAAPPGSSSCVDPGRSAPNGPCALRRSPLGASASSAPCGRTPSRRVARRFSGRSSRHSATASRRCRTWPKRSRWIRRASSRRRVGWRRWAASSSGGEPSNATPSRIGPRACRSETSLRRSNVPPSTRSGHSPRAASSCSRASPHRARPTCTSPPSRRRWTRAGRRSCSSRR